MDIYTIWNFLNQNIISEAIGVFIFGLIVKLLLDRYLKIRETKAIIKEISFHLKQEVKENYNTAKRMKEHLEDLKRSEVIRLFPPILNFNTSILSTISHRELLKILPTQQASLIIELLDYCNKANKTYEQLDQLLKEHFRNHGTISIPILESMNETRSIILRNHLIRTLEENLLPSIIQTCDELLSQLKDTTK